MFWKHINSKHIAKPDIPSLKNPTTGLLIERSAEKADLLNTYFTTVFTQEPIQSSLPTLQTIVSDQTPRVKIDLQVVLKKLKELRISKSPGQDGLHPRVLKETADLIAEPLSMTFQKSLQSNELPSI
jgi:hypothetical protein